MDGETGLPNREGWDAVLAAEEERSRRHGGTHGLVLVQIEVTGAQGRRTEEAALAIARALREIDLLARIDHRTFGVLALHCEELETVVRRLRSSLARAGVPLAGLIDAHAAGADLRATWSAMTTGSSPGAVTAAARYIAFVPSARISLN